jgi:proton-translocating NAD(P)+ transhydrogenase subunit alpha
MSIGILKEARSGEARVAATPEIIKKLCARGLQLLVEKTAGIDSRR